MSRYALREKADSKTMQSAIAHSKKGRRKKISTTDVEFDPDAKRRFDANYDEIFGKKGAANGGQ